MKKLIVINMKSYWSILIFIVLNVFELSCQRYFNVDSVLVYRINPLKSEGCEDNISVKQYFLEQNNRKFSLEKVRLEIEGDHIESLEIMDETLVLSFDSNCNVHVGMSERDILDVFREEDLFLFKKPLRYYVPVKWVFRGKVVNHDGAYFALCLDENRKISKIWYTDPL